MKKTDMIPFEMAKKAKKAGMSIGTEYYYNSKGERNKFWTFLFFNKMSDFYSAVTYKEYLNWINTKK